MSTIRLLVLAVVALTAALVMEDGAQAAKMHQQSFSGGGGGSTSMAPNEMLLDVSYHYVRDTKPDGGSDSAARFSIGGMFNEWVGMDFQGLYQVRDKNYLVGGDFRFVPVDWFFLKGGAGAYASKDTHALALTPLFGAGIMAHLTREIYVVTESEYFSVNNRDNISFGVGLGTTF